jgi:hypothetical protein
MINVSQIENSVLSHHSTRYFSFQKGVNKRLTYVPTADRTSIIAMELCFGAFSMYNHLYRETDPYNSFPLFMTGGYCLYDGVSKLMHYDPITTSYQENLYDLKQLTELEIKTRLNDRWHIDLSMPLDNLAARINLLAVIETEFELFGNHLSNSQIGKRELAMNLAALRDPKIPEFLDWHQIDLESLSIFEIANRIYAKLSNHYLEVV